eukprot:2424139-Amphidinium_carterae.1
MLRRTSGLKVSVGGQDKLCEILGYLSCIAIRDFGYQCMDKLGKLMLSGQQLAKIVLNTLATVTYQEHHVRAPTHRNRPPTVQQ